MMGFFDNVKDSLGSKKDENESKDFKYLDGLIHSGSEEIVLDCDIIIGGRIQQRKYNSGIKLDVDGLVIDGNGHTIDAKGKTRIFYCTGKNITIKNITLKNGYAVDAGAIYNEGVLFLNDSKLEHNSARDDAGAIANLNGELTITKTIFFKNTAKDNVGAIFNIGKLTITESTLNNNTAEGGSGGAIYNDKGELIITESTLTGNTAKKSGGAIYSDAGELAITESTLTENTAKYGGAIFLNNKTKKYESNNCTFKDNKPDDVYEEKD